MMTNEETVNEVRATFQLEGKTITQEQEERIKAYLEGRIDLNALIQECEGRASW